MATPTDRLGLARPDDNDEDWGGDYRAAMTTIDAAVAALQDTEYAYRHVQGQPASTWTIVHNLGFHPGGVVVKDTSGDLHEGHIDYPDINTITISFLAGGNPIAFSGEAYIS